MKIKTGDKVKVIAGKDKGKEGKVIQTFPAMEKVVVEGVNILKKHLRPRKKGDKGQRIELPAPFMSQRSCFLIRSQASQRAWGISRTAPPRNGMLKCLENLSRKIYEFTRTI